MIVLAGIAAVISYKHMYELVVRYGESSWTAALLPVSVDGMIVVASMSLLVDSRQGRGGGLLPWTLLVLGSAASLAANVAVAEPSAVGRLIAAWPSCALIGSYELLMRQIRRTAVENTGRDDADANVGSEGAHMIPGAAHRSSEEAHSPLDEVIDLCGGVTGVQHQQRRAARGPVGRAGRRHCRVPGFPTTLAGLPVRLWGVSGGLLLRPGI
ncbi:DUF2637 domain-containing protein [Actinomadura vinacea]|uniref:DUF2637 domain-containing protein n=1 Tax=Actinomadura vinacea TaxID=115336 RepID=UPI0031DB7DE1